jgi:hypothetical protein
MVASVAALLVTNFAPQDGAGALDAKQLKEMITNLGYEAKALNEEVGKEKYEFKLESGGFDIWIAAEISASKNYVWLTVLLGDAPSADSAKPYEYLKRNNKIQPTFFYVTDKGKMMMGYPMDNRGITPPIFRRTMTKLSTDCASTADLWDGEATQRHPE